MGTINIQRFEYTLEELEETMNSGRYALLDYLLDEKKISQETYNHCIKNVGMIIKKPSFFCSLWKNILSPNKEEGLRVIIVEQKSFHEPKKEQTDESTGKTEGTTEGSDEEQEQPVEGNDSSDNGRAGEEQ